MNGARKEFGMGAEKADNIKKAEKHDGWYKESVIELDYSGADTASTVSKHSTPPPPYLETCFTNSSSFKAAVNARLEKPAVSLFQVAVRLSQLAFALASGIPYAIELDHRYSASTANFIFAEIVFGLTLLTLVLIIASVRYCRLMLALEWSLSVLWIACFGVFHGLYLDGEVPADYAVVNFGRMEFAGWCNLVNAILWFCSAIVPSVMCCSGIKATSKEIVQNNMREKDDKEAVEKIDRMESGTN